MNVSWLQDILDTKKDKLEIVTLVCFRFRLNFNFLFILFAGKQNVKKTKEGGEILTNCFSQIKTRGISLWTDLMETSTSTLKN